jgi:hypothetical protein
MISDGPRPGHAFLGRTLALLATLGLASCSSLVWSVHPDTPVVPGKGDALVMGKVSFSKGQREQAHATYLRVVRIADGRVFRIDPNEESAFQEIWGAQFFVQLPAGRYRVGPWSIEDARGYTHVGRGAPLVFTVRPGELVCIGHLFLEPGSAYDVCPELLRTFKDRIPPRAAEPVMRPATH